MASSTGIDVQGKTIPKTAETIAIPENVRAGSKESPISSIAQINTGGIGENAAFAPSVPSDREKQYAPNGSKSLAGIALRSHLLGVASASSFLITVYLLFLSPNPSPLWRISFFTTVLSVFHFLEFYTTAYANTTNAQVSSFLLSANGLTYNLAHATAFAECLITNLLFPSRHWIPDFVSYILIAVGLGLVVMGQVVRTFAIMHAGPSFNHIVQSKRSADHKLVTDGIYAYLRHPSYFGFFWWALGTQLVLGNPIAFLGYAIVLHRFFNKRIATEETRLMSVNFFEEEYSRYRAKTPVGIPFIQ